MSLPIENSARSAATLTPTSFTWASGTPSSGAAPTSRPETVAPRPVKKLVETRPMEHRTAELLERVAASACARLVRMESSTRDRTKRTATRTPTTMARTRTQRFWKGDAMRGHGRHAPRSSETVWTRASAGRVT